MPREQLQCPLPDPATLLPCPRLAVAACAALSAVDHAQQLLGRRAAIPPDVYIIGLMGAWHPVLWRCCGGGWGSVLGEALAAGAGREGSWLHVA